jgi:hypothetical protein
MMMLQRSGCRCGASNGASRRRCRACGGKLDARTHVGSIAGVPTIAEVKELIAAKDAAISQLGLAYAQYLPQWLAKSSGLAGQDALAWKSDFDALAARYAAARTSVLSDAAVYSPLGAFDSVKPDPGGWDSIMAAVRQAWPAATETKGDLQELDRRLEAAGKVPAYNIPQPTVDNDADLRMFKAADVAAKGLEKLGGQSTNVALVALVVVGGVLALRAISK